MRLRRIFLDKVTTIWMITALGLIIMMPLVIGIGLYIKAMPIFEQQSLWSLITSSAWAPTQGQFGFWPFITGSLYVTLLAFIFAAPVCLLAAIHLTQFAAPRLTHFIHPVIDILAGIPSVIYGVWGVLIVVPFVGERLAPLLNTTSPGYSILAGGIVLGIMCIPYMLNMLIDVFNTVPIGMKEASLSLGATRWEAVKHVVIRKSFPGIISAFGLSIAKAFGETIAVMMVVGNRINVTLNPFESGYPLPALIANNYGEMLSIPMYDAALMFSALLLLVVILAINLIFRFFIYKTQNQ
jgi:phosphate transport system permease protein